MPVRNEGSFIRHSLSAVIGQDYPKENLEILVLDGMSTDETRSIIRKYQAEHPNVRLIDNPGQIVPTGLNIGLKQASGEIIIRVDGHTLVAPDYVKECVQTLEETGVENVGGKMSGVARTPFGQAVVLATSSPFGVGNARFHYSDSQELVDTVYLGAWPRGVFDRIGLFDEEMVRNQDDELNYRLRSAGGKILLNPKIKSQYTVRSTPKGLWKQYFQYGYWKVRVLQKHPRQMSYRQFVPPIFVATLILTTIFSPISKVARLVLAATGALYLLANGTASLSSARQTNWRILLFLPVTFGILHLSYGSGFLLGLVKFANRWKERGQRA